MAKQEGIVKLSGRVGDLILYKTKEGFSARLHRERPKEIFKNSPRMESVRRHTEEFAQAGKIGKHIRSAFRNSIRLAQDPSMSKRLHKACFEVIKSDAENERGERVFFEGNLRLLTGFDFNAKSPLKNALKFKVQYAVDRTGKSVTVYIPEFTPTFDLTGPATVTHVRFFASAVSLQEKLAEIETETVPDFAGLIGFTESDPLPVTPSAVAPFQLKMDLPEMGSTPIAIALGVDFRRALGSRMEPVLGAASNACAILHVEG